MGENGVLKRASQVYHWIEHFGKNFFLIEVKSATLASKKVPPPSWEERSRNRVLEIGGDQILERSRRIVEAAYDLLNEAGLDGLTIRAVLEKTGLSRRAFYERFAGKDD